MQSSQPMPQQPPTAQPHWGQYPMTAISQPPPPSEFQVGLCDCGDNPGICVDGYFCFPCQVSRQCKANDGYPDTCDCAYCFITYYFAGVHWAPAVLRCKLASKFNIDENCCVSCMKGVFCPYCSLCQTGQEMQRRGIPPGSCYFNEAPEAMQRAIAQQQFFWRQQQQHQLQMQAAPMGIVLEAQHPSVVPPKKDMI